MSENLKSRTQRVAELYFKGVTNEKPYDLWRAFDPDMAKQLSVFITGGLYAREKIPHATRQLVTIAVLTVLGHAEELKLHIHAALNVGCTPAQIFEVILQTFTYNGIPAVNTALKAFRDVLQDKDMWPLKISEQETE